MDVSTSEEFIKVYEQISKLQEDITNVAKDCYDTSVVSYNEIEDAPQNLSDFNNDLGFVTEQCVDDKINDIPKCDDSNFLKKSGENEQQCDIPTKFDSLQAKTQTQDDSTDNVATTEFVHAAIKEQHENTKSWVFGTYGNVKDCVTQKQLDQTLEDYATKQNVETIVDQSVNDAIQKIDIPTNTSDLQNDSGFITIEDIPQDLVTSVNGKQGDVVLNIPQVPTNVSAFTNDAGYITDAGVTSVNNKTGNVSIQENVQANWSSNSGLSAILNKPALKRVATTGDYNDLNNLPDIPDISNKYDKNGGNISGSVDIDGNLTLNIEDEDYDSGIVMSAALNNNLGTVLTLNGYANANGDNTNYRPILRNIGTPNSNYDAANKKYVDDNILIPNHYFVFLNQDGTVDTYSSNINYENIKSNLTDPTKKDYLDVIWGSGRFLVSPIQIVEVNTGDIKFISDIEYDGIQRRIVFTLNNQSVLTTTSITTQEIISNKKTSVIQNISNDFYPTTNAVYQEFQRKPVVVWEVAQGQSGLLSSSQDITVSPNWQLTGLNMSQYKRIKIYTKAGRKSSGVGVDASNTPAVVLEMSLDDRAASPVGGHFIGSYVGQKPNDPNRLFTVTCAVSSDKSSFAVLRMASLYGTAATENSDCNGYVFKIEGYFD